MVTRILDSGQSTGDNSAFVRRGTGRLRQTRDVPDPAAHRAHLLAPNQPAGRPYRGGLGIARLRGIEPATDGGPEDLVGSTTAVGPDGLGLTVLDDGVTLRDHVHADPVGFLGAAHADRYGADPALLVKLLDTAERLFVHVHPTNEFAVAHLDCPYGKTEAWYVVDVRDGAEGEVFLGFSRDVSAEEVRGWVEAQDAGAMLAAMNRLAVRPGDAIFVPGGTAHAIGAGLTIVELQQPTDWSVLLEWDGYGVTRADADLGIGLDTALGALNRTALTADDLDALRGRRAGDPLGGVTRVFPVAADPFFRAELLDVDGSLDREPGFTILVVLTGSGELGTDDGALPLRPGSTVLVPHGAGDTTITGQLTAIACLPPRA